MDGFGIEGSDQVMTAWWGFASTDITLGTEFVIGPGADPAPGYKWLIQMWINGNYLELGRDWDAATNHILKLTPNDPKGRGVMKCLGNSRVGTATCKGIRYGGGNWDSGGQQHQVQARDMGTVTFRIPDEDGYRPQISFSVSPDNGNLFVQGMSRITYSLSAEASAGTYIRETKVVLDTGEVITASSPIANIPGKHTAVATATDGRGLTTSKSITFEVLAYTQPKISTLSAVRCTSSGVESGSGTSVRISYGYQVQNLTGNTASARLERSSDNGSSWTTISTFTDLSKTGSQIEKDIAPTASRILLKLTISDKYASTYRTFEVGPEAVLMAYNTATPGVTFGRDVTTADAGKLVSGVPFKAEKDLEAAGTLTLSQAAKKTIIDLMHPVGTVIWLQAGKDPNSLFSGTTWKQYRSVWRQMKDTGYVIDYQNSTNPPANDTHLIIYTWTGNDDQKWSHALSPASNNNAGGANTSDKTIISTIPWLRTA